MERITNIFLLTYITGALVAAITLGVLDVTGAL
jgi:hypothetical protein